MNLEFINIGKISLSDKVVISDPCYTRDVWCMIEGLSVQPGTYQTHGFRVHANATWGKVVVGLLCYNVNEFKDENELYASKKWEYVDAIGVDSAHAGIFDDTIFPSLGEDNESFKVKFWNTLDDTDCGLYEDKGIVSGSGFGDGSYYVFSIKKNDASIAILIDFELRFGADSRELFTNFQYPSGEQVDRYVKRQLKEKPIKKYSG